MDKIEKKRFKSNKPPGKNANETAPLSLLSFALEAVRLGFSVLPTVPGEKRPALKQWKLYQKRLPTTQETQKFFPSSQEGLGVAAGKVSGNVEFLDFDNQVIRALFYELAERTGLGDTLARMRAGYEDESPNGGHLPYRCEQIAGNQKLALTYERAEGGEIKRDTKGKPLLKTLIETKGEGGFVIIAPSAGRTHPTRKPYKQISGGLATIATITPDERESLLALARSLNEITLPAQDEKRAKTKPGGTRPGDVFNNRATWDEVLLPSGWVHLFDRGEIGYWRRPGKDRGISATTNYAGTDYLYVFSTSTDFESERGYSKFSACTLLYFGGDFTAAAQDLIRQGYVPANEEEKSAKSDDAPQELPILAEEEPQELPPTPVTPADAEKESGSATTDDPGTTDSLIKTDPSTIDPLAYLAKLEGTVLSPSECLTHYRALLPSLLRVQTDDPPAYDLAVSAVVSTLGVKAKTMRDDLAKLTPPPAAKEARALVETMGQTSTLRLAHDYQADILSFGVLANGEKLLVNSERVILTVDNIPKRFTVQDNGFDLCRFSKTGILRFLAGTTETGSNLLTDLRAFFLRFAVFRDPRIALLLAVWTLGTYCYRVFRVFPYLALRSPEKRCGKSRVLDLLSLLAFNASAKTVNPTEAQLFRSPSRNGGALLLDEIEMLAKTDKGAYLGLLSVLNNAFEQNGSVERQAKDAQGNFVGVKFETFCPYALAGINKTAETLEDRSIMLFMHRKLRREKTARFSPARLEAEAQTFRDRCYIWALTHAGDLAAVYDRADTLFGALGTLDDRARDLWEPLASITAVADAERGDKRKTMTERAGKQTTYTDDLTALVPVLSLGREGAALDSTAGLVITALEAIAVQLGATSDDDPQGLPIAPTDLANLLKEQLGWTKLSTKTLANLVNPLGLYSNPTRFGDTVSRAYRLSPKTLVELRERYVSNTTPQEQV